VSRQVLCDYPSRMELGAHRSTSVDVEQRYPIEVTRRRRILSR
jgi:hypothetical protein